MAKDVSRLYKKSDYFHIPHGAIHNKWSGSFLEVASIRVAKPQYFTTFSIKMDWKTGKSLLLQKDCND